MKLINFKIIPFIVAIFALLALSGCDSITGISSDSGLTSVDNPPVAIQSVDITELTTGYRIRGRGADTNNEFDFTSVKFCNGDSNISWVTDFGGGFPPSTALYRIDGTIIDWYEIEMFVFTEDSNTPGRLEVGTSYYFDGPGVDFNITSIEKVECTGNSAPEPIQTQAQCLASAGYGTVTLTNGQVWLDRNLGASSVGLAGDYYQWGRMADGHEKLGAGITSTQATTLDPNHGDFITSYEWTSADLTQVGWDTANGTNQVCPCGFVVPSQTDFSLMLEDPARGQLNLPISGARGLDGNVLNTGRYYFYWLDGVAFAAWWDARTVNYNYSKWGSGYGYTVRCIDPSSRVQPN